jgi:hypothetical protein
MGHGIVDGKQITDAHYEQHQRQQIESKEEVRREASALVRRVAEGYSALRNLMEQNPWLTEEMDAEDRERKRAFDEKLQQGLRRANDAPRCRWVRQDGTSCGSPQMRNHIYCHAHRQMMEARALALRLPAPEDANSIQVGLMRIQKALIDDTITAKKAGLLLYSMQLAMTNVGRTTFGKANDEDLVTDTVDEEEALSSQHSAFSQSQYQNQTFETRRNGGSGEGEGLPRMNTDDSDREKGLPRMDANERGLKPEQAPRTVAMRM